MPRTTGVAASRHRRQEQRPGSTGVSHTTRHRVGASGPLQRAEAGRSSLRIPAALGGGEGNLGGRRRVAVGAERWGSNPSRRPRRSVASTASAADTGRVESPLGTAGRRGVIPNPGLGVVTQQSATWALARGSQRGRPLIGHQPAFGRGGGAAQLHGPQVSGGGSLLLLSASVVRAPLRGARSARCCWRRWSRRRSRETAIAVLDPAQVAHSCPRRLVLAGGARAIAAMAVELESGPL